MGRGIIYLFSGEE